MPIYCALMTGRGFYGQPGSTYSSRAVIDDERAGIASAVKLDITTVAQAYHGNPATHMEPRNYPCAISPWPVVWMEGREDSPYGTAYFGVLCVTMKWEDALQKYPEAKDILTVTYDKQESANIKWVTYLHPWLLHKGAAPTDTRIYVLLNSDGDVIGHGDSYGRSISHRASDIHAHSGASFHIPIMAMSLANCKNIITEEQTGAYKPSFYSGRKRKNKKFYRYHVLKIDGSHTGAHEGKGGHVDKAMHICRGHFKRFTDEKPLFGRLTGLYWWPMHVRGSVKNGVVDKDYSLAAPEATSV